MPDTPRPSDDDDDADADTAADAARLIRRRLDDAHRGLLGIHKALLDHERARFERQRGPIAGPGQFLQLVIDDPFFAWLRPASSLAALVDEFSSDKDPIDPADAEALLNHVRWLLSPSETGGDFQRQYHRALHESPAVAMAHAQWKLALAHAARDPHSPPK